MLTIISGIFLIITAVSLLVTHQKNKKKTPPPDYTVHYGPLLVFMSSLMILVGFTIMTSAFFTFVPTKNVGVGVSYGKVVGTYSPGPHLKAPWVKVIDMDATIQNSVYTGDNRIPVRLGSTASALLDVSIQWRIREEGVVTTYLNYQPKGDATALDVIESNVIDRNLRSAINTAFGSYDPLSNEAMTDGTGIGAELRSFEESVVNDMKNLVDDQLEVVSITITNIDFDEDTDKRISDYQAEIAKTRNAEQAKETAQKLAEANRILSESLSDEVNTANCLAIVEKNNSSPLGCFPGTSAAPVKNVQ